MSCFSEIALPEGPAGPDSGTAREVFAAGDHVCVAACARGGDGEIRLRVLRRGPGAGRWETAWEGTEEPGTEEAASACSLVVRSVPLPAGGEVPMVRFLWPGGARLLRVDPVTGACAPAGDAEATAFPPGCRQLCRRDRDLVALCGEGRESRLLRLAPGSGTWEPLPLAALEDADNREVSALVVHAGALFAATVNPESGFELWRLESPDPVRARWSRVLERGAWRYAQNRRVLAALPRVGSLYLVAGTPAPERTVESMFLDYQGPEVIRVDADGHWDLLVGVPRVSPAGFQVPLSGLGPGFDPRRRTEFGCAAVAGPYLVVAVADEEGFGLWLSTDGERWWRQPEPAWGEIHEVLGCRLYATAAGLVVVVDHRTLDGERETRVWLGDLGCVVQKAAGGE